MAKGATGFAKQLVLNLYKNEFLDVGQR